MEVIGLGGLIILATCMTWYHAGHISRKLDKIIQIMVNDIEVVEEEVEEE